MNPKFSLLAALATCTMMASGSTVQAATYLKLSDVNVGTEQVTLVANGDFEGAGAPGPFPSGWARQNDMFADTAIGGITTNTGSYVASGNVNGTGAFSSYTRNLGVSPNTDYVLSAYIWNFGDASNYVNSYVDFNDLAGEAQLEVGHSLPDASDGYFAYETWNSGPNSSFDVRVVWDGKVGTGAATGVVGAQWDNIALTLGSAFVPPTAIPEPNSLAALAVCGVSGLGIRRRRQA